MSSLLNPLHPGTLFIQKRLGQQFLPSGQIIMPPLSTFTYQVAPPVGRIWIAAIQSLGSPRDAATNNPIISPLIYYYTRHSMIVSGNIFFGLESSNRSPWGIEVDIKVNDPLVTTVINATALTLIIETTYAIMEITEDKYDQYMDLWNGLYNLETLLGSLREVDVTNLANILKSLTPQIPPVVPILPIPQEVTTSPTLREERDGIRRIEIP